MNDLDKCSLDSRLEIIVAVRSSVTEREIYMHPYLPLFN